MPAVEFTRTPPRAGEGAAYDVSIGGHAAARIAQVGRRWRLEYGGFTLTLATLGAARGLDVRYADRILEGRALDLHEPACGRLRPPAAWHAACARARSSSPGGAAATRGTTTPDAEPHRRHRRVPHAGDAGA